MKTKRITRAALVYQAGIANVFAVTSFNMADYGRDAKRLFQGDFYGCRMFCRGLIIAGIKIAVFACNEAGDITNRRWTDNLEEQPFYNKFVETDEFGFMI